MKIHKIERRCNLPLDFVRFPLSQVVLCGVGVFFLRFVMFFGVLFGEMVLLWYLCRRINNVFCKILYLN